MPPAPRRRVRRNLPARSFGTSVATGAGPHAHAGNSPAAVTDRQTGHSSAAGASPNPAPGASSNWRRASANPAAAPSASRNGRSSERTRRPSRRRPTTSTPRTSVPGPGAGTITSAPVSVTQAASSGGSKGKTDGRPFGSTRTGPPAVSNKWTMAVWRPRGAFPGPAGR